MWVVSLELFLVVFFLSFCFVSSVQFRLKFITSFLFSSVLIVLEMVTNEPNKHACKLAGRDFGVRDVAVMAFCLLFASNFPIFTFHKIGLHGSASLFGVYVCECHMITVIKSRNALNHAITLQNNTHINTYIFSRILPFFNDFYRSLRKAK